MVLYVYSPLESLSCLLCTSHLPYLCSFTSPVLHGYVPRALLQLFLSVWQISQKSEPQLHRHAVRKLGLGSQRDEPQGVGLQVCQAVLGKKNLLTSRYEDLSLLLSSHIAGREQRATTHT